MAQIQGGPAVPVSVVTGGKIQGGRAIPVYGYTTAPTDGRRAAAGPARPVYVVSDADIAAGVFKLEGGPAQPMYVAPGGMAVEGDAAQPVYVVGGSLSDAAVVVPATPPLFSSAEVGTVNSTTVVVTFDSNVSASDYTAGVTIKVGGSAITVSSGTRQANHAIVYYVVTPAVAYGNTVTWEYAAGSGNIVGETGGAALANVSAQNVTNNVANPLATVPWVAQWKFNNDGNDSIGANNLAAYNSPTFTTGKIGGATGATQLVAASLQYWSIDDNAALSVGDVDFFIGVWVYLTTVPGTAAIITKDNGAASREWGLYHHSTAGFTFFASGNGSAITTRSSTTFGAGTTATWYCVMCWHDATANTLNICVNNGTVDSVAYTVGIFNGTAATLAGVFGNLSSYWNGRIDNLCIAKGAGAVLTAAQRTAFYNAGAGTETLT